MKQLMIAACLVCSAGCGGKDGGGTAPGPIATGVPFAGFCDTRFRVGDRLTLALIFFQTEDRVSGATFAFGPMAGFTFSTPGRLTDTTVGEDGQIRLSGTGEPILSSSLRYTLENIRLESPAPGVMEGVFEQRWFDTAAPGIARVFVRLDDMTREILFPTVAQR